MKKRLLCLGISAVTAVSSIGLSTVGVAAETEAEYMVNDESDYFVASGETRIYAVEIAYGMDTITLGAAVTSTDRGDSEIALILQDDRHVLFGDIGNAWEKGAEEERIPLLRIVNNDLFVNGKNLAGCFQLFSGEDNYSEWLTEISPETGWICIDEDFISMFWDALKRMPDLWEVEWAAEQWADSVYVMEENGGNDEISFNETTLLALTMTLDQLVRECQNSVNTFLEEDLKVRFGDTIADALMDSGRFPDRIDAEAMMENGFLNLRSTIRYSLFRNSFYGFSSLLKAFYDSDLTGWLLQGLGEEALEGMLELDEGYGKLTLTADGDTVTLEAGGSDALFWGRTVDSDGELLASLVVNNGEREKAVLFYYGGEYLHGRMTFLESDIIAVSLQDGMNRNQFSGLLAVGEDDSIVFTPGAGMYVYGPLKSIRLYSEQEESDNYGILEVPQAMDLDTLVYRAVYENMKSQEACEDETVQR